VEGVEKYQLMAASWAVLMPSRHETFGMVAIESQAAGAPLVTFDIGPLREVLGEGNARFVPPFDLDAFVDSTIEMVTRPDRARDLRAAGRAWARQYDWAEIAARQEAHYERALHPGQGH
jgi:glycosyltransferase involved in cell wall biosynthesis